MDLDSSFDSKKLFLFPCKGNRGKTGSKGLGGERGEKVITIDREKIWPDFAFAIF